MTWRAIIFVLTILPFVGISCTKEVGSEMPENPYLKIDYSDTLPIPAELLDPNTIEGLHQTLFKNRCAVPACHDGAFEPDFRTVQSSYSTLVYHPITKNNTAQEFTFRVVPFSTQKSVLHERLTNCCFVNENDRMPQDNIGKPLEDKYINAVKAWINKGAPDMFGNVNLFPNLQPIMRYHFCVNEDFTGNLGATENRFEDYKAFKLEDDKRYRLFFVADDDSSQVADFSKCRIEVSEDALNFASARKIPSEYFKSGDFEAWQSIIDTSVLPKGRVLYFRIYINDGDHKDDTELPSKNSPSYFFDYYSFYIMP